MRHNIKLTREVLTRCGFLINEEKSCLKLTQIMECLGFVINSVSYTVSVSQKKMENLHDLVCKVLKQPTHKNTIRHLAKIIGKIVALLHRMKQSCITEHWINSKQNVYSQLVLGLPKLNFPKIVCKNFNGGQTMFLKTVSFVNLWLLQN